jgi:DNA modification methylase
MLVREEPAMFTFKEASEWATEHTGKNVTPSNISYLVNYGRIKKLGANGSARVSKDELVRYYQSYNGRREVSWKEQLGSDLNWALSFDQYKEAETTKHVHRLHPYKGKFIPQLVEYFLDGHTDNFKKEVYFSRGDIILDPFCGSGTTLVQSCELGMHAIGIDVSSFNALISNVKVGKHNLINLQLAINSISRSLKKFLASTHTTEFENRLLEELYKFNNRYFPVPAYKYKLKRKEIDEEKYGAEKEKEFLPTFERLVKEYEIKLSQDASNTFLDKWYSEHVRKEIDVAFNEIHNLKDNDTKKILAVILSRTIRSCRATTHADLATLVEPITKTYYCSKHGKVCKPLFSILKWWEFYASDTVKRLGVFDKKRTSTHQVCLAGDSRTIDVVKSLGEKNPEFATLVKKQKISGIFSSPPYVGLIDYHEQHAYAYDLFKFERQDDLEIGRMFYGQGKVARDSYVQGISDVLNNCKRFLAKNYNIFLVANDKFNLYPTIAAKSGMQIVKVFKRPVLRRSEGDKNAYAESIFHMKPIRS